MPADKRAPTLAELRKAVKRAGLTLRHNPAMATITLLDANGFWLLDVFNGAQGRRLLKAALEADR